MVMVKGNFLAFVFLFAPPLAFAQGGPPLVTDDPGTPGNGNWEINTAVAWSPSVQSSIVQFPLFDINYGYGDHIQLNLNTSLVSANVYGVGAVSGMSLASLGTKIRFIDEERAGVAISAYPRIDSHILSSNNTLVNAPGSRCFLPIEFSKEFGKVGVNPEVGYAAYSQALSEWAYGIAASYAFEKEKEALVEVHGRSRVGTSDRELLYNVGSRYALRENLSFIGALGRTVTPYSGASTAWNFYAGVQLRL